MSKFKNLLKVLAGFCKKHWYTIIIYACAAFVLYCIEYFSLGSVYERGYIDGYSNGSKNTFDGVDRLMEKQNQ